jgi:hypothetical protein
MIDAIDHSGVMTVKHLLNSGWGADTYITLPGVTPLLYALHHGDVVM